jgi:tetratricopeptide (TPR) repeat protein
MRSRRCWNFWGSHRLGDGISKRDTLVLPLRIDIDAFIVTHTGIVLDGNNDFLVEYDTLEEAEMFVAETNGLDVDTLRLTIEDDPRLRHEYHRRLEQRTQATHSAESEPTTGAVVRLTTLALSQDSLGRPDEAARTLEPALQTAIDILFNLGRLNFRAKRPARAIGFFRAAALLAPDSEDVIHGVGRVLMDLKGEAEAVPFLVRATKLNPRCTDAWYDLGVTLSRLKQRKKARSCFARALRLDPKHAWAHYDLACLDALEGKPSAAFQNLEKATSLGFQDIRHLRRDTDLRSLRRDVRWKPMLAAMLRSAERRRC